MTVMRFNRKRRVVEQDAGKWRKKQDCGDGCRFKGKEVGSVFFFLPEKKVS